MPDRIDVNKIKMNRWRQGNIFPQEAIQRIAAIHFPAEIIENSKLIIVSQSCDIAYHKEDEEPYVEVLLVTLVPSLDNSLIQGRNPRRYHLKIQDSRRQTPDCFEANIENKYKISRNFCADFAPCTTSKLLDKEVKSIVKWLTYRYIRPAFPDEFNKRINSSKKALKNLLKKGDSHYLSGIYLYVIDKELSEYENYVIKLLGAIPKEFFQDPEKRKNAEKLFLEMEKVLNNCKGIDAESECKSEEGITLDEMHDFQRFTEYDYMSQDFVPDSNT